MVKKSQPTQLNHFKLPLKTLEIAIQRPIKLKIFQWSMPPDPPRGYRLWRAFIQTPLHEILDLPQEIPLEKMLEMAFARLEISKFS